MTQLDMIVAALRAAPQPLSNPLGEKQPAGDWPSMKMALWNVLMAENLNDGHYIKAFDLIERLYGAAILSLPAEGGAPDEDLIRRCRELLEWSSTGLLAGGQGGAIRALADRLKEKIGETYALSVAESQTRDDAMRAIVALSIPRPHSHPPEAKR